MAPRESPRADGMAMYSADTPYFLHYFAAFAKFAAVVNLARSQKADKKIGGSDTPAYLAPLTH